MFMPGMHAQQLPTHNDIGLVCVSVAAAIVASYVALDLAHRAVDSRDWHGRLWTAGAGVTMGLGIWSMHFIGMLALEMSMPVSYDGPLVILSLLAAVIGASVSFSVVARPQVSRRGVLSAAAFMGFAIAAMHYLGMASMQTDAVIHWNLLLVALSLAIGFGASLFGLWLIVRVRTSAGGFGMVRRLAAAVLLGFGIAGLHYTAMSASSFWPTMSGITSPHGLRTNSLVVLLAAGAFVMLAVLIAGAAVDQRRAALASDLSLVANLARQLARLGNARDAACEAIRELAAADYVLLVEPFDDGGAVTASSGTDVDHSAVAATPQALAAMRSGRGEFVSDLAGETAGATRLHQLTGAASLLFEPLLLDGRPVGVLVVAWCQRIRSLPPRTVVFLAMLASEAAVAIERERLFSQLEYLSRRDELTGLFNRRVLDEELGRQLTALRRDARPLSIAMLDMDRFKAYNDEHGHQAGDRLLRSAAAAWSATLRETDTLARYGGEEFVAILPDCTLEAATAVADQLREAMPAGASCSAGVATTIEPISVGELIGRADRALYAAKRAGRDRTGADHSRQTSPDNDRDGLAEVQAAALRTRA
ncbi:MAG TPA: MHYT domain-containing protein [Solirubrobacteraceae bacterium]|nr:MHYT domain-containing protein [Solirubrobacteraceae bacterium]